MPFLGPRSSRFELPKQVWHFGKDGGLLADRRRLRIKAPPVEKGFGIPQTARRPLLGTEFRGLA
eukprot:14094242-Alexandrium_andersonii.AAC.1